MYTSRAISGSKSILSWLHGCMVAALGNTVTVVHRLATNYPNRNLFKHIPQSMCNHCPPPSPYLWACMSHAIDPYAALLTHW